MAPNVTINIQRHPPSTKEIDEMEQISLTKGLQTIFDSFVSAGDPERFERIGDFQMFERNAWGLSHDYLQNVQKNVYPENKILLDKAARFATGTSNFDFVTKIVRAPRKLRNEVYVKMMKEVLKDCLETAYQLAEQRRRFRTELTSQQILENTTHTRQVTTNTHQEITHLRQTMDGLALKMNRLFAQHMPLMPNNLDQPQPLIPPPAHPEFVLENDGILPAAPAQNLVDVHPQQEPFPANPQIHVAEPANAIELEERCKQLHTELLSTHFSTTELLLPELPNPKVQELQRVVKQRYPEFDIEGGNVFKKSFLARRQKERSIIFKQIGHTLGYAISDNGFQFFFKLTSKTCYQTQRCTPPALRTKQIGNFKIPKACPTFNFLLIIEKPGTARTARIIKLLPNGNIEMLQ